MNEVSVASALVDQYSKDVELQTMIVIPPHLIRSGMKYVIQDRLIKKIQNTCTSSDGFIIKLRRVLDTTGGAIEARSGSVKFTVRYIAQCLRPLVGDIVQAIVTRVLKIGIFADLGPLNIFIPANRIPEEAQYVILQPSNNPAYVLKEEEDKEEVWKIQVHTKIDIRIEQIEMLDDDHPKPFTSDFSALQSAAIESWKRLKPEPKIYLLGDDEGIKEAAERLGVQHISNVEKNEWGTPLVSSIFEKIREKSPDSSVACYINTDIVLGQEFMDTVNTAMREFSNEKEWLLIGRRENVELPASELEFNKIRNAPREYYGNDGIDYFVFPKDTFQFVYPFALGKFVWDQYLVGQCYRRGIPCVDCSETITALHLNAPWYFNGSTEDNRQKIYDSEEGTRNRGFEYYQKNIGNGTNHVSYLDDQVQIRKLFE